MVKLMTNYVRIINNIAVDVCPDPRSYFHPQLAVEFEEVPDEVSHVWRLADGLWQAPPEVPAPIAPASIEYVKVSPIEFMLFFTNTERVAIKAARPTDPVIDDFMDILGDPRLTYVDTSLSSIKETLDYLVGKAILEESRVNEILSGTVK